MISRPRRKSERHIEFVVGEFFVFMKQTLPYPRLVNFCDCRSERREKLSGEARLPDSNLGFQRFCKSLNNLSNQFAVSTHRQLEFHKRSQLFIGAYKKTLPLSRCASATKMSRPSESTLTIQPQLHQALVRLLAMDSHTSSQFKLTMNHRIVVLQHRGSRAPSDV
jgi:hypothetical protein